MSYFIRSEKKNIVLRCKKAFVNILFTKFLQMLFCTATKIRYFFTKCIKDKKFDLYFV